MSICLSIYLVNTASVKLFISWSTFVVTWSRLEAGLVQYDLGWKSTFFIRADMVCDVLGIYHEYLNSNSDIILEMQRVLDSIHFYFIFYLSYFKLL